MIMSMAWCHAAPELGAPLGGLRIKTMRIQARLGAVRWTSLRMFPMLMYNGQVHLSREKLVTWVLSEASITRIIDPPASR